MLIRLSCMLNAEYELEVIISFTPISYAQSFVFVAAACAFCRVNRRFILGLLGHH